MDQITRPTDNAEAAQLKVLIVDDEPMLRSVIEEFLGLIGYDHPVMAGDGREALELLRHQPFDCMISDIRMPEMALEELLPIVNREFPRLIVIATSGYSDFEYALNIIDKGAHDFLGKPLNLDSLETALSWISRRRPILARAAQMFGGSAAQAGPDGMGELLSILDQTIASGDIPFLDQLQHSRRVTNLVLELEPLFNPADRRDLALAALLHEMGGSFIMQSLVDQPRRLEEHELHLVRAHAQISGRLVANYLGRPEFTTIIGEHYRWGAPAGELSGQGSTERRLAVWLGLFNYIDGCLRARPDRMPYRPDQVRESLKRRHNATHLEPIGQLLEHWPRVVACYPGSQP